LGAAVATFLAIAGASVWMESAGDGSAVVFLHAGIADSRMWDAEFDSLQKTHRVVRLDLRGFGRSVHIPGKFSYRGDVLAVLDSLKIDRATVVGCSFGSRVALDFAVAYPERVHRLILVSPSVGDGDQSEEIRAYHEREEAALDRGDLDEAVEVNLRMWVDGPRRAPGDVDAKLRAFVGVMQRAALEAPVPEGVSLDRLDPPARDRLADVKARTLVVAGSLDVEHTRSVARRLKTALPDARLEVIEGAAHLPSLEKPGEWSRLLNDFLAEP
jgi:pimeloyl-ACP methyl ester carboxylesterase